MLAANSVLIGLLALMGAADEPAALVEGLGAARYVQREEAAAALQRLGREALPALRAARRDDDPEVRARAGALLGRIESELMVRPTLVRLDFRDRPLAEVVQAISQRSGISLTLVPDNPMLWQNRRVTLVAAEPMPFWSVLDRLSKAADLQTSIAAGAAPGVRGSAVHLTPSAASSNIPTSDNGPFRATVHGIHHHRDLTFAPHGGMPNGMPPGFAPPAGVQPKAVERRPTEQFYLDLQLTAEPRMGLAQNGPLKLIEALDDKGHSLLPQNNAETVQRTAGYFGGYGHGFGTLQAQIHLRYPDDAGRAIKRIRGTIPVIVSARKDDPISINLAESKGKTFQSEEASLTVHDVKTEQEGPHVSIEISIRPNTPSDPTVGGRFGAEMMAFRGANLPQSQIEILDAQGHPYPQWFPSSTQINSDEVRMTLRLMPSDGVGPPAQVRFYDMARATAEASFEFHDVPMP